MTATATAPVASAPDPRSGAWMRARAHVATELVAEPGKRGRTRICGLRSEAPIVLRPTIGKGVEPGVRGDPGAARVTIAAGAAGPVGGDHLSLTILVGAGSTLVLTEVSCTLLLPGRDGTSSKTDVRLTVERDATLVWLPEPAIAVRGCDHVMTVHADVARGARLLAREELLLGRHGESSGRVRTQWRVEGPDGPLLAQDLSLGAHVGHSVAVAGAHRAVGSVVALAPGWPRAAVHEFEPLTSTAALLPLAGGGALVSALADDSIALRGALEAGIAALGPPWSAADEGARGRSR